jgi:AcrR family transcriptional regulator
MAGKRADSAPGLRRVPEQTRSRETLELILSTAAALLAEVGLEAFNTNLLAERAGVRVRTVYRYFPNKLVVITTLAQRMVGEWNQWFDDFEQIASPSSDWRAIWSGLIDKFIAGVRELPGGLAVRQAMHAIPELWEIDQKDNARLAQRVAVVLQRRAPSLGREEAQAIARTLLESAVALIDLALAETPGRSRALIEQLKQMHLAYLALWLGEARAAG